MLQCDNLHLSRGSHPEESPSSTWDTHPCWDTPLEALHKPAKIESC